ncbi:MAG: helix-turn-helix domain-containing protein [Solirubrobacterales bacterium]
MSESSKPQPALGAVIRSLREKRGLTQEALAQGGGITVAHLSKIERGLTNPTWGTVAALAEALGSSMGEVGKLADKWRR